MKKTISIIAAIAIMLSIFCVAGTTSANAETDRVSLYSASATWAHLGSGTYEVYVQTKDNASDQAVYVHYYHPVGITTDWYDAEAVYVTTLDDGSKIWRASFTTSVLKYCIKYVADGVTYWDNNNGNDYSSTGIGSAPITVNRNYSFIGAQNVNVFLKNYGYEKNVFVRYTTDGWNTYNDQPLTYSSSNENGTVEHWNTTLSLTYENKEDVEYAVCYQVNGQTYWANNFGENYDLDYVTIY